MNAPYFKPLKRIFYLAVCFVLVTVAILGILAYCFLKPYYLRAESYDLKTLEDFDLATIFYDRSGSEIGRLFTENRVFLKHDEIPNSMRRATVAVEDKRFYSHKGIDLRGIARALYYDIKNRKCVQGGSTLTQQIAKHLIGHSERTLDRKLVEAFLAFRIEREYSKAQILDLYLNRIYFGKGYFGLGAAAKGYFGKAAKDLTVAECATLASIIKAPNIFSPRNDIDLSTRHRNFVLLLMAEQHLLTNAEADKASVAPLLLVPEVTQSHGQGYFMALATKDLRRALDLEEGEEIPGGLSVRTTLDAAMQRSSEAEVVKKLGEIEGKLSSGKQEEGGDANELQVAALTLDLNSGAVRVLIGGRDYQKSPFDRARMARRENGALLQPFIYSLAFDRLHLHPASMVKASFLDDSAATEEGNVGLGDPENDLGKPFLMVQDALASSNRACASRVGLQLGVSNIAEWLSSAGVRSSSDGSGSLMALEQHTLYEITSLYQMLGNGGRYIEPYCIESVVNNRGETLYQRQNTMGRQLLTPVTARQMSLVLQSAVHNGSASILAHDGFASPVAGMTGYSAGYRDAWFVGYTPSLATGVWIGYDRSVPIEPQSVATKSALSIWENMMQRIVEKNPGAPVFPVSKILTKVEVEKRTGIIQGMGFMAPAPENEFVYLTQEQIRQAQSRDPATTSGKSGWLDTMAAGSGDGSLSPTSGGRQATELNAEIPPVIKYRMPALRGDIFTADGKILATTTQSQNLVLNWPPPDVASADDQILAWVHRRLTLAHNWLKKDIDITDADLLSLYRFQRFQPILVAQDLTSNQINDFSTTSLKAEGFSLQGIPQRLYPQGDSLAHVLGYLQRTQGRSHKQYQAEDVIYDDYHGAAGLEGYFDKELRGQEGQVIIETTPDGFTQKAVVDNEATMGASIRLTINSKIQEAAENSIDHIRSGAVIVMNIHNGDILAMASRPTFDPNSFIPFLPAEKWEDLVQDVKRPLLDRVYRQQNPPGSSFKIITTLAAMRAGVFDENRKVDCPGFFQVGNMRYILPQERSSPISFRDAIAHSYNTYFFDLGLRAGRDALVSTAQDLGIGQPTGFILPGELSGLMPDDRFVRIAHKRAMGPGDVANASVGQGDVLATPLQMVTLMSAVANGGTLYRPRLVEQIEDPDGKSIKSFPNEKIRVVSLPMDGTKKLISGLVGVTEMGTGKAAQIPGLKIASKTGTAQVGTKTQPRQIAWFVGFLPAYDPQYAFAVMVEGDLDQDLHGGGDAAPVAGKLFGQVFSNSQSLAQIKR